MATTKVEINSAGAEAILKSSAMKADLERRANAIAAAANQIAPGHEASATIGRTRALAMVWTGTIDARLGEAHHRSLTQSIDAGR